jgi:hypothetical protein
MHSWRAKSLRKAVVAGGAPGATGAAGARGEPTHGPVRTMRHEQFESSHVIREERQVNAIIIKKTSRIQTLQKF